MQQESTLDSAARQRLYTGIYDDCSWLINLTGKSADRHQD